MWPRVPAAAEQDQICAASWAGTRAPPAGQQGPFPSKSAHIRARTGSMERPGWLRPTEDLAWWRQFRQVQPGDPRCSPTISSVIPFHCSLWQRKVPPNVSLPSSGQQKGALSLQRNRIGQDHAAFSCFPGFPELQLRGNAVPFEPNPSLHLQLSGRPISLPRTAPQAANVCV